METKLRKPTKKTAVKPGNTTNGKRKKVDWDAAERDFRTGKFTHRELATKYGVSHAAIGKQAREHQWQQDLTEEIRQATNSVLVRDLVAKEVAAGVQEVSKTVLIAAETNAQVIRSHRTGLNRITRVKDALLDQIEQTAMQMPEIAEIIEMARNPDDNGNDKLNDALRKAMSRSALVDDLKKLAEIDERVRKGEREAFGISDGMDGANPEGRQKRVVLEFVDVEPK